MGLMDLPPQKSGVAWPTQEWPLGELPGELARAQFNTLIEYAFSDHWPSDLGETHALVIVQHGRVIFERYASGMDASTTQPSWSKAKSMTQALVGILVRDGKFSIEAPADVPEWQNVNDPRRHITHHHLLQMASGLGFREEYQPDFPSDTIEMLWGEGKNDTAHFAAEKPLVNGIGDVWSYASGTTNILSRACARAIEASGPAFESFMRTELFDPLGMQSPVPKFDAAGTFVGSSFCFATPRDFARFGLLYLRDGLWEGKRLLPEGWVSYARTPATAQTPGDVADSGRYGAHWWLDMFSPGSFSANGYDGQYTICVPDRDLIVVRHGKTPLETKTVTQRWLAQVIDCFPTA